MGLIIRCRGVGGVGRPRVVSSGPTCSRTLLISVCLLLLTKCEKRRMFPLALKTPKKRMAPSTTGTDLLPAVWRCPPALRQPSPLRAAGPQGHCLYILTHWAATLPLWQCLGRGRVVREVVRPDHTGQGCPPPTHSFTQLHNSNH